MALDEEFIKEVDEIEEIIDFLIEPLNEYKNRRDDEKFKKYYNHINERFCIYQVRHYEITGSYYRMDMLDM